MTEVKIASLCRICLGRSELYSDIYSRNVHNEFYLYETINDVCQLGITLGDELPSFICADCHLKICEFEIFKDRSQKGKSVLEQMVCKLRQRVRCHSVPPAEPTERMENEREPNLELVKTEPNGEDKFSEEYDEENEFSDACDLRAEEEPLQDTVNENGATPEAAQNECNSHLYIKTEPMDEEELIDNIRTLEEPEVRYTEPQGSQRFIQNTVYGNPIQGTSCLNLATRSPEEESYGNYPSDPIMSMSSRDIHRVDCLRRVELQQGYVVTRPPRQNLMESAVSEMQMAGSSSIRIRKIPLHVGQWAEPASTASEDCVSNGEHAHIYGMPSRRIPDTARTWYTRQDSFGSAQQQQEMAQSALSSTEQPGERCTVQSSIDTIDSIRPLRGEGMVQGGISPMISKRQHAEQHMVQGDMSRMASTGQLSDTRILQGAISAMSSRRPMDGQCIAQHSKLTSVRQVAESCTGRLGLKMIAMTRHLDGQFAAQASVGPSGQVIKEERISPQCSIGVLGSPGQLEYGSIPFGSNAPGPSKSFACELCGRRFARYDNLRVHMRVHSGERPYSCEQCGKAFSHLNSLKTHRRLHTGEKPFECKTCAKAFTHKGNLIAHEKSHSVIRAYSCVVCGKNFKTPRVFRLHSKTHHVMPLPAPDISDNEDVPSIPIPGPSRASEGLHLEGRVYNCLVGLRAMGP